MIDQIFSEYHCGFIILPRHKMTLNKKYGRTIFFQFEDFDTWDNLCEKYFYPASIKNENRAVVTRKTFVCREWNQQLH